jgi:hypothetical protein
LYHPNCCIFQMCRLYYALVDKLLPKLFISLWLNKAHCLQADSSVEVSSTHFANWAHWFLICRHRWKQWHIHSKSSNQTSQLIWVVQECSLFCVCRLLSNEGFWSNIRDSRELHKKDLR